MADRSVHYEAAFEHFLRQRKLPYVAVDEAKRALFATARLKSFDFVVYGKEGSNWLIDVKGRACGVRGGKGGFQTWATETDIQDLAEWERVFGQGFKAVLVFVYWIRNPSPQTDGFFQFRDRSYLLMGVELGDYRRHMRRRSAKWKTVCLGAGDFRSLARPLDGWL